MIRADIKEFVHSHFHILSLRMFTAYRFENIPVQYNSIHTAKQQHTDLTVLVGHFKIALVLCYCLRKLGTESF